MDKCAWTLWISAVSRSWADGWQWRGNQELAYLEGDTAPMHSSLIQIEDVVGRDAFGRETRKVGMEQDIIQCTLDHLLLWPLAFERADLVTDTDYPRSYTLKEILRYTNTKPISNNPCRQLSYDPLPNSFLSMSPHTISPVPSHHLPVSRARRLLTLRLIRAHAYIALELSRLLVFLSASSTAVWTPHLNHNCPPRLGALGARDCGCGCGCGCG